MEMMIGDSRSECGWFSVRDVKEWYPDLLFHGRTNTGGYWGYVEQSQNLRRTFRDIIRISVYVIYPSCYRSSLAPLHPSPHNLINSLDPLPSRLNLEPLPMLPPAHAALPAADRSPAAQLNVDQPLYLMCIRHLPRRARRLVDAGGGEGGGVVGVVADEGQVVATLARPLVEAPLHVLRAADLQEDGFLTGAVEVEGEGVQDV